MRRTAKASTRRARVVGGTVAPTDHSLSGTRSSHEVKPFLMSLTPLSSCHGTFELVQRLLRFAGARLTTVRARLRSRDAADAELTGPLLP